MADSFLPFRILGFPQSFTCCIYCCSLFFVFTVYSVGFSVVYSSWYTAVTLSAYILF